MNQKQVFIQTMSELLDLLPLLLDIQLNKRLPPLFSPPMLRALQDERNSFSGLVVRKRRERAVLAALVGAAVALLRACVAGAARLRPGLA